MNEIYLRFPGGKRKAFTISYDDNITQDERLIQLMEKYRIKGTFNIIPNWFSAEDATFPEGETYINVTQKKALQIYNSPNVEVANHGFDHTKMTSLPTYLQMEDIVKCRKKLEALYDGMITGFAYPYGWYNDDLKDILRLAGITYARRVQSTHSFDMPEDWLDLQPTCHHAEPELVDLTTRFINDKVYEGSYMFYVWGHTFEFDQQDNWYIIENLFKEVYGRDDIWYATNGEICNYHKAYQSLVYSADGTKVFNPTSQDIWIEVDNKDMFVLPSGKTTDIFHL